MFVTLNHRTTIYLKQLTAGFLLVWFASIWMVQGFHHHPENTSADEQWQVGKASITAVSCAICDYHFAKDADAVTAFAILPAYDRWLPVFPATEWSGRPCPVGRVFGRGPPFTR